MKLTLNQSEIHTAITDYVKKVFTGLDPNVVIIVDMKAGRGDNGHSAEVDVSMPGDLVNQPEETPKPSLGLARRVAPAPAPSKQAEEPAPTDQEQKQDPETEAETDADAPFDQDAEDLAEAEAQAAEAQRVLEEKKRLAAAAKASADTEGTAEATAAAPKKSLFAKRS